MGVADDIMDVLDEDLVDQRGVGGHTLDLEHLGHSVDLLGDLR